MATWNASLASACTAQAGKAAKPRVFAEDGDTPDGSALDRATGTMEREILGELESLDLGLGAAAALTLVPVLEVVWRSPEDSQTRHRALRTVAAGLGLSAGDFGFEMLIALADAPDPESIRAPWRQLMHELVRTLAFGPLCTLQWELRDRVQTIASTLYGADAGRWPSSVFNSLKLVELACYGLGDDDRG